MIETYTRDVKMMSIKDYCHFAQKDDYITVTEWKNGEGFDVELISNTPGTGLFSLTYGEWKALTHLVNYEAPTKVSGDDDE